MGASHDYQQRYTAVCVACRWGDTFTLTADGEVMSALEEANRRHKQHRRERDCLLVGTVFVVNGMTDPTVEKVGSALMQPFINVGASRIVEMIADAFGLRPVQPAERRPTITSTKLVVTQGLVPEGILETADTDDNASDLAEEAMKEELALIGA